ncbi:MAG: hypothetical protein PHC90_09940 [Syntrophorhabdaceae bacterium]|nr:hypothetical protein [Syntrophorhabdaceae bacterium]
MKSRIDRMSGIKGTRGNISASIREGLQLLAKSCERYGRMERSKAPEVIMDMERLLIWKRIMFLFNVDPDRRN